MITRRRNVNRAPSRRVSAALIPLGLLLAAGCGLTEYDQCGEPARALLKQYDDENKYLGAPLDMPMPGIQPVKAEGAQGKGDEVAPAAPAELVLSRIQVYLRPPKGISDKPAPMEEPTQVETTFLYRYPGSEGYNLFLAGDDQLPAPQFQKNVRDALRAYSSKAHQRDLAIPEPPKLPEAIKQPLPGWKYKLRPVLVRSFTVLDPDEVAVEKRLVYQVYYHTAPNGPQGKGRQVAIIYQAPLAVARAGDFAQKVDFSLKTLGVGDAAQEQRSANDQRDLYRSRKR